MPATSVIQWVGETAGSPSLHELLTRDESLCSWSAQPSSLWSSCSWSVWSWWWWWLCGWNRAGCRVWGDAGLPGPREAHEGEIVVVRHVGDTSTRSLEPEVEVVDLDGPRVAGRDEAKVELQELGVATNHFLRIDSHDALSPTKAEAPHRVQDLRRHRVIEEPNVQLATHVALVQRSVDPHPLHVSLAVVLSGQRRRRPGRIGPRQHQRR